MIQTFLKADSSSTFESGEPLKTKVNYFIGNDQSKWIQGAETFGSIIHRDLYPGVDVTYGGTSSRLSTSFHLDAGIDPSVIQWRVEGQDGIEIQPNGALLYKTAFGPIALASPSAYQTLNGVKTSVVVAYIANDKSVIGFQLGSYRQTADLFIDL